MAAGFYGVIAAHMPSGKAGGMYKRSLTDPNGRVGEAFWKDPAAVTGI